MSPDETINEYGHMKIIDISSSGEVKLLMHEYNK